MDEATEDRAIPGADGTPWKTTAAAGAWDGPTLPLRLVEVASGQVHAEAPVPAKCIAEYEGARVLVIQAPDDTPEALEALAREFRAIYGPRAEHMLLVPVERMEDLQEFRFEVPLPSADDPTAVEWFAERLHGTARPLNGCRECLEQARSFLRWLAEWPGAKGGASA